METIDADVDAFFSKFDTEEIVDKSDSVTDKSESDTEIKEVPKEVDDSKEQLSDKSKEESKDKSEEDSGDDADKNTPFHKHPRWKEKLKENKELREKEKSWEKEKEEMIGRISKLESKPLTDDELNNMTPKEIQEYTRKELEKEMKLKQETTEKQKAEANKYIEESLNDIKDAGHKFDENKLLTIAEEYTGGDIEKAFDLYQKLETTKESGAEQEAKRAAKLQAAQSNKSNRGSGGGTTGFVSGTSWGELNLK